MSVFRTELGEVPQLDIVPQEQKVEPMLKTKNK